MVQLAWGSSLGVGLGEELVVVEAEAVGDGEAVLDPEMLGV